MKKLLLVPTFNVRRVLPCCPCSRFTFKCAHSCPCKQPGAHCSSCGPLSLDHCCNHGARDTASLSHPTQNSLPLASGGCPCPDGVEASGQYADDVSVGPQQECGANDIFRHEKSERAFGATLLNHHGGFYCEVRSLWWKVVALRGRQYSPPDGGIGTRFVNMLS